METNEELLVLGENVRQLQEHFNYSKSRFAPIMGFPVPMLRKLEEGYTVRGFKVGQL